MLMNTFVNCVHDLLIYNPEYLRRIEAVNQPKKLYTFCLNQFKTLTQLYNKNIDDFPLPYTIKADIRFIDLTCEDYLQENTRIDLKPECFKIQGVCALWHNDLMLTHMFKESHDEPFLRFFDSVAHFYCIECWSVLNSRLANGQKRIWDFRPWTEIVYNEINYTNFVLYKYVTKEEETYKGFFANEHLSCFKCGEDLWVKLKIARRGHNKYSVDRLNRVCRRLF